MICGSLLTPNSRQLLQDGVRCPGRPWEDLEQSALLLRLRPWQCLLYTSQVSCLRFRFLERLREEEEQAGYHSFSASSHFLGHTLCESAFIGHRRQRSNVCTHLRRASCSLHTPLPASPRTLPATPHTTRTFLHLLLLSTL